jgi:hypothetical protein
MMIAGYEILRDGIDMHIHSDPDIVKRVQSEYEVAVEARAAGYRGVVLKQATFHNPGSAAALRQTVPGVEIFTGIVLNHWVGGLNPEAVIGALALGAKIVWMPTYHAAFHLEIVGRPLPQSAPIELKGRQVAGISISQDGKVLPQVEEICELIAQKDAVLATGHLSPEETELLVRTAVSKKVNKILVTHAEVFCPRLSVEQQIKMVKLGAYIEHAYSTLTPYMQAKYPCTSEMILEAIKATGAGRCVISTDVGQIFNPSPIEAMRCFILELQRLGLPEKDIDLMFKKNPADLLGV